MGKIPCANEELRPGLRTDEMKVLESVELTGDGAHCSFLPVFLSPLLSYVTELTDRIRAKSTSDNNVGEDSGDFVSFFPDFVWTLRDFSLDLKADGEPITADEYLENSLKLKQGKEDLELINGNDKAQKLSLFRFLFTVFSYL